MRCCSLFISPRILHCDEDYRADAEIHQQTQVLFEKPVPDRGGQMWHEQEVDRIACENGHERVEKVLHHRSSSERGRLPKSPFAFHPIARQSSAMATPAANIA
jgi:hypothetical protein